jgi:superoxide dismutase
VPLNHDYSDYEPLVDTDTMRIHHSGHYKAYTDNLNTALREAQTYAPEVASMQLGELLQKMESRKDAESNLTKLPFNVSMAILNNGGGYLNHVLFFNQLREFGPHAPARAHSPLSSVFCVFMQQFFRAKSDGGAATHVLPRAVPSRHRDHQDFWLPPSF